MKERKNNNLPKVGGEVVSGVASAVQRRLSPGKRSRVAARYGNGTGGQRPVVQFDLRDAPQAVGNAASSANDATRSAAASTNSATRSKGNAAKQLARAQHEARNNDEGNAGGGGPSASFHDMPEDDTGPEFHHDHGHLDDGSGNIDESLREDPTWGDHLERLKWIAKLEAAELLRPDLVDGTSAYRHFLSGGGAERDIQYGRFIHNDSSGQAVLASAVEDTRQAALERSDQDLAGAKPTPGTQTYQIRTDVVSVGNDGRYPYPSTENWQKAIGAHSIWIEATITVTIAEQPAKRTRTSRTAGTGGDVDTGPEASGSSTEVGPPAPPTYSRHFEIEMTIHAEDRYNFNPGDTDIATGTPDSANGRFEITGLGHEFLSTGTYSHRFEFDASMDAALPQADAGETVPGRSSRSGRPSSRRPYPTTR